VTPAGLALVRPFDPSPDEARSLLRRELLKPEYYEDQWLNRIIEWFIRQLDRAVTSASDLPGLSVVAAMFIGVLLIGGLAWLASRARLSSDRSAPSQPVWADELVTAAQLRIRAEEALNGGRIEDALTDGFRALARRQAERGRLEYTPGTTAQESARSLGSVYPHHRSRIEDSAGLFDAVLYGDRPATREQAVDVLELDEELGSRR
jgi:hypothetical protein